MNIRPLSDSEKILWEKQKYDVLDQEMKQLKKDFSISQKELEDLKYELTTQEIGVLIIENKKLKEILKDKEEESKIQKREIELLFDRIVKLQTPSK